MFGIGGFNPISLLATTALGPVGGIVAQLAQQVFSQIGQQLIQQLGQQLGLPQSVIGLAQDTFALSQGSLPPSFSGGNDNGAGLNDAVRDYGEFFGASPREIAQQQDAVQDFVRQTVERMGESEDFKNAKASRGKGGAGASGASSASAGGQGWLMAMAKVLGQQLDDLGEEMTSMAKRITKDTPGLSAEFGVVSQQFGMLMNATSNAIKTVGESMGRMASKQ